MNVQSLSEVTATLALGAFTAVWSLIRVVAILLPWTQPCIVMLIRLATDRQVRLVLHGLGAALCLYSFIEPPLRHALIRTRITYARIVTRLQISPKWRRAILAVATNAAYLLLRPSYPLPESS